MTIELLSPSGDEPIPLAEAKAWLRVDHSAEDGVIASLLAAARATIESATGHSLVQRHLRETLFAPFLPPGRFQRGGGVRLAFSPLIAIERIEALRPDGGVEAFPLAGFRVDLDPAILFSTSGGPPFLPDHFMAGSSVRITARFGYVSAEAVPAALREAILRLTAASFEARGMSPPDLPALIGDLIAPFRRIRL